MDSIFQKIQAIYDAGTPIFTKDGIRKVGEELGRLQNREREDGANITLTRTDGVDYEVLVKFPEVERREDEHIGGAIWMINYNPIAPMTGSWNIEFFDFQKAHLPMRIFFAPIM
ncbi:hypothetical protein F5B22DRAFT_641415 [Xylaria bambusicola]|uniref:uncharacterized protein n=1 Tax=Xylaria bambusicola TaxID=326684 RepID=UPI0020079CB2|nr:uncharacterized protein F5B22DRAFT_641415 [Xylaria bambusicola]KAI0526265.1 hypothetical protein F5B22DRAFT_641415 [Xylaria bambusicola]